MATAQQSKPTAQATAQTKPAPQPDAAALLNQILERQPSERFRSLSANLDSRIERIEEVLPDSLKGQAQRLAKRAMMTFARNKQLENCPPADFIRCVIEAAEIGLAIDGKLAYVVRYKDKWQMQPDYKGLIAVAKRSNQIKDCYAEVVYEHDKFNAKRVGSQDHLFHERVLGASRGKPIGAYAVVIRPDGSWRYELMDIQEIDAIKGRSNSKKDGRIVGPWVTDEGEMRKKTIIRRALKLYCDDPAVVRALELSDNADALEPVLDATQETLDKGEAPKGEQDPLAGQLGLTQTHESNGTHQEEHEQEQDREPGSDDAGLYDEQPPMSMLDEYCARADEMADNGASPREISKLVMSAAADPRFADMSIEDRGRMADKIYEAADRTGKKMAKAGR